MIDYSNNEVRCNKCGKTVQESNPRKLETAEMTGNYLCKTCLVRVEMEILGPADYIEIQRATNRLRDL